MDYVNLCNTLRELVLQEMPVCICYYYLWIQSPFTTFYSWLSEIIYIFSGGEDLCPCFLDNLCDVPYFVQQKDCHFNMKLIGLKAIHRIHSSFFIVKKASVNRITRKVLESPLFVYWMSYKDTDNILKTRRLMILLFICGETWEIWLRSHYCVLL